MVLGVLWILILLLDKSEMVATINLADNFQADSALGVRRVPCAAQIIPIFLFQMLAAMYSMCYVITLMFLYVR